MRIEQQFLMKERNKRKSIFKGIIYKENIKIPLLLNNTEEKRQRSEDNT